MVRAKKKQVLGRTLIKQQGHGRYQREDTCFRHTTETSDGTDWARLNLRSITEQTNIDEFLATAELAGTEFTAEKENITIISAKSRAFLPTDKEISEFKEAQQKFKKLLSIPRRPPWDDTTTPAQLQEKERENFLVWRKQLADLQEQDGILLTPYEKNLEFWRQLWRVVERSDIVIQIVDARNPLLFWCEDLEQYVKEVNPNKVNVLLLNKADFLSDNQRETWARYFQERGMVAVFFSALESAEEECSDSEDETNSERGSDDEESDKESIGVCLDVQEALAKGKVLSREELVEFWLSLPVLQNVKEGVTTVGLVGYPNVGKSSTINSLLQFKKVSVSATPGKTKHFQTLMLSEDLCLCDCPGLVFPSFVCTKAEMIIYGILPIDQMLDCVPPVALLTTLIPAHVFESTYSVMLSAERTKLHTTAEELLNAHGYMRGFMTQRGLPDASRSSRYILKDFVDGKLLHCQAPPGAQQENYHTYPLPTGSNSAGASSHITPAQHVLFSAGKVSVKDLEATFFKKANLGAHRKGEDLTSKKTEEEEKPWRKHNNKHKREKLRRVYSHLDN